MAYDKIVDSQVLDNTFTEIANAIRNKTGSTDTLKTSEMAQIINEIQVGDNQVLTDLIEGNITSIDIPKGVTEIRSYMFCEYKNLTSITISQPIETIGLKAFAYSGLIAVDLSNCTFKEMPNSIFEKCENLESVKLPDTVTKMFYYNFLDCKKLKTINIPKSLTTFYPSFTGCTSLEFVTIGQGFNCDNLNLSASTKLTDSVVYNMIKSYQDRAGLSTLNLTVNVEVYNILSDETKALAAEKNITIKGA